ncbi:(d)CMP kinase [Mangrovicoccus algicola]|uniref:Cytidylate kinase n=1 Tax=Mangrovicoccus algicola TaxID=2771008 RepID=A0A8J6ZAJ5_9RHOB|nr:(d)CMP kinase [Mangrovicoccus algicola]MBE3639191.1 (d)CMP kinase [Mangrovicoccus algicola]
MKFTVAIDGPAAAGKGTIARALAAQFGFGHLDTGLLYRATARRVMEGEEALSAALALQSADLRRDDLRSAEVGQVASRVAAMPKVRTALLDFQKNFARRDGGAVLDGRDIGTVICPDAEVKLFVTATDGVRAARRHAELSRKDAALTVAEVLADLRARDRRDAGRDTAPMSASAEALLLDTSELTIDEAIEMAGAAVIAKLPI